VYCIIPSFKRINVRTIKVAVMLCLCMPFSVMVGGGGGGEVMSSCNFLLVQWMEVHGHCHSPAVLFWSH